MRIIYNKHYKNEDQKVFKPFGYYVIFYVINDNVGMSKHDNLVI